MSASTQLAVPSVYHELATQGWRDNILQNSYVRQHSDAANYSAKQAQQLRSSLDERITDVKQTLSTILSNPNGPQTLLVNTDGELDDSVVSKGCKGLFPGLLQHWSSVPLSERNQLVIVVGDHHEKIGVFENFKNQLLPYLDQDGTETKTNGTCTIISNPKAKWTILSGAKLEDPKEEVWVKAGAGKEERRAWLESWAKDHQQDYDAAKTVDSILQNDDYLVANWSSARLFSALAEVQQSRDKRPLEGCKAFTMTSTMMPLPTHLLRGANRTFAPASFERVSTICKDGNIPFVELHGSTLGFEEQSLAELKGWEQVLRNKVVDPAYEQGAIEFGMHMLTNWGVGTACQTGQYTAKEGSDIARSAFGLKEGEDRESRKWVSDILDKFNFETVNNWDIRHRLLNVASGLRCPLNNTVGDTAWLPILSKSLMTDEMKLLPYKIVTMQPQSTTPGDPKIKPVDILCPSLDPSDRMIVSLKDTGDTIHVTDWFDQHGLGGDGSIVDPSMSNLKVIAPDGLQPIIDGPLAARMKIWKQGMATLGKLARDNIRDKIPGALPYSLKQAETLDKVIENAQDTEFDRILHAALPEGGKGV